MDASKSKSNWLVAFCIVLALALFWGIRDRSLRDAAPSNPVLRGETMGTYYNIKLVRSRLDRQGLEDLKKKIQTELAAIEKRMSIYDPHSEISRFNQATANQAIGVSEEFAWLLDQAITLCEQTDGAFDPTVGLLVDLWGFGKEGRPGKAPAPEAIAEAQKKTGWRNIVRSDGDDFSKRVAGLEVDLGGIAKGHGVDRIADVIKEAGFEDFMVEIGGEVYAAGLNSTGIPWRIGIDTPALDAIPGDRLRGIVEISDMAVATSGDYRNYFKSESGRLYSHIIDPRTGYPARMPPASVTVVADNCMTADALATAFFVLGEKDGLALAGKIENVEALYIISDYGTIFREAASSGFHAAANYRSVD